VTALYWNLQGADAKHGHNPNLLLPMQIQAPQLRQGDAQHLYIHCDTESCVRPGHGANVNAGTTALAAPVLPVIADGCVLKHGRKDEGEAHYDVEDDRSPDNTPDSLLGKMRR
jgi:hypothetical protein